MFKFKGISSTDMQVVIEEEEHFIARASQRYEMTEIEGRDGAIFEEQGYSVVERPILVQCLNVNKIDDILAWLDGEGEFEYKGRKTTARFYSELEPRREACIRIIDTTFIRDPFWTKVEDEYEILNESRIKTTEISEDLTVEDASPVNARLNIKSGKTIQEEGTPSPDNIIPIRNVGDNGSVNLRVENKNFLNHTLTTRTIDTLSLTVNEDRTISFNGTRTSKSQIDLFNEAQTYPAGSYILNGVPQGGSINTYRIVVYNNNQSIATIYNKGQIIIPENNKITMQIAINANVNTDGLVFKPMLRLASIEDDTYVPHQEQNKSFPLTEGQVLHEGDYLAEDGIHQKRKTLVLDGTENFSLLSTSSSYTRFDCHGLLSGHIDNSMYDLISTHFKSGSDEANTIRSGTGAGKVVLAVFMPTEYTTLTQFKTYLATQYTNGTPVTVEYELAEEIVIPYTEEQEEAYYQLQHLLMYEGCNYITCIDEIKPDMQLEYEKQLEIIVKNNGNIDSRPLLKINKTKREKIDLSVNDIRFICNFLEDENYIEIDCKEKIVLYKGLNRSRQVEIGYEFPKMKVGENKIKFNEGDAIIEIKRKDRWL